MAKFRSIKNSFLGGMISRTAVGRTDLPQYSHSCELLQNVIPMLSGGVYRRPGTIYQDYLESAPGGTECPPRLIPFIVDAKEVYCVLVGYNGAGYVKTYRPTAVSGNVSPVAASGSHPWQPRVVSSPSAVGTYDDDWWQVQFAQSADIMWLTHPAFKPQVLRRTGTDTFSIHDFDNGLTGLALAQAYPYLSQNATSATMTPSVTTGTGTLTCSTAFFQSGHVGAIFAINQAGTGGEGASGSVAFYQITSITSSTVANMTVLYGAVATSASKLWWESAWSTYRGWPRSVCIYKQRLGMAGTSNQPDSIWFSQAGGFFKFSALGDKAVAGVTGTLADGTNFTTPGDYVYYPVDDSQGDGQSTGPIGLQPFRVTLAQSQLDSIQWLSPDQELLVGTLEQEWIVSPVNGSFDVANSAATIQSHYGSDFLPAVRIGYELMFALRSQDEVRAYQYNYIDASFFGEPVQMFFDEYPKAETNTLTPGRRKFRQMEWDVSRSTLWCLDTCGNLFGMTRDRKLQVTMWHTHQFGGYDPAKGSGVGQGVHVDPAWSLCDGSAISMSVIPNPFTGINDIWLVIKRTLSNNTQPTFQVERLIGKNTVRDTVLSSITAVAGGDPIYVDGGSIFTDNGDGTFTYPVGPLNGYSLVGTYYSLTYGMFPISTPAVTGTLGAGVATLNQPLPPDYGSATPFHAFSLGLPYTSIIKTVRQDAGSVIGTAQGAIKKIARVYVRFFKTLYSKIGAPPGTTKTQPWSIAWGNPALMGQSPEIFTGDKAVIPFITTHDRDQYVYLEQDQPMPWTVVSLVTEGEEFD